ncbi:hypothetical protein CN520_29255 [Bacillus cereus]|nr:hypothetical protein CON18_23430 [Bacillus cereus]PET36626.1 hypothetical protein CN520_29255 [Bacillus cereus]PEY57610.1 hypothetical protein CN356_30025 [Bacillus cereus]PFA18632.1 hypothetical protein CN377_04730 [Bacillus cereus]PFS85124.1 hypothetical protein COK49_02865 [Bacillus cereus]
MTANNENYVNKLSIWAAYFIFCLTWFFSKILAVSHAHQPKVFNYPHNKNFNFLQLFMRIWLNSFVLDNNQFLKWMVMESFLFLNKSD